MRRTGTLPGRVRSEAWALYVSAGRTGMRCYVPRGRGTGRGTRGNVHTAYVRFSLLAFAMLSLADSACAAERTLWSRPSGGTWLSGPGAAAPIKYRICYSPVMEEGEWEIYQTDEVAAWMRDLRRTDPQAADKVEAAVDVLAEYGPTLGRPLVDTLVGSKLANLKELRPRQSNIRILLVFDPWRSAILLVAGDKTGQWHKWYEGAIPQAEQLFALYLKERAKAEEDRRD
jgi:hypothetical protein